MLDERIERGSRDCAWPAVHMHDVAQRPAAIQEHPAAADLGGFQRIVTDHSDPEPAFASATSAAGLEYSATMDGSKPTA